MKTTENKHISVVFCFYKVQNNAFRSILSVAYSVD
jgi:hypothetical protein